MLLGEILHRGTIKISMESTQRFAAIDELIDALVATQDLTMAQRDSAREAVIAREKSMGTGMEMGVALPHGSSEQVRNIVGALGISREGIDFNCLDGLPAKLILLLVLPRDEIQVHVRTLAGISHLLNGDSFRKSLMDAPDADAILKLIRKEESSSFFDQFRPKFK